MKSVLVQLEIHHKPKLKNIPTSRGIKRDQDGSSGFERDQEIIKFLPNEPKALLERLFILLGCQQAGNDSQRNEAISIMDNLLKNGIFDKQKYQSIYNEYFKNE